MKLTGYVDGSTQPDLTLTPEVCIIGSGAGGAVAAHELVTSGREVLVVEEGGNHTRRDFHMLEGEAYPQLYQEAGQRTTKDLSIVIMQGRAVGGTTVVNWTTCFRTPPEVLDHWRVHHGVVGVDTAALDPHWAAVEERLNIHKVPEALMNRNNRLLYEGCKALGWDVDTTRRNQKGCKQSGYCGMGCPVDAKQSMLITYLPDAVNKGASVLSRCRIDRLRIERGEVVEAQGTLLDAPGLRPTGKSVSIRAKKFVLSAGSIGTPAILLRSGIENPAVGRRTFLHPVVVSVGVYDDLVLSCYGAPQSAASHQFAHRGDKVGFVLEAAPLHPVLMAACTPGLGPNHRAAMELFPRVAVHIALCIDGFHPDEPGGVVGVHASGAPYLDYRSGPRIQEAMREAQQRMAEVQFATGARSVMTLHDPVLMLNDRSEIPRLKDASFAPLDVFMVTAHVMGGCALGEDPRHAVVRSEDLRAHDVKNLHVVDGSVFPTSLGVNPQLSIYGLARLASSRMAASWARG
ncbi:MAG: GMC family oxidoreductase [Myxococcota bacterium]